MPELPSFDDVVSRARPSLKSGGRAFVDISRAAVRSFTRHGGGLLAGATAFYSLMSIVPVLFIAVYVAGLGSHGDVTRDTLLSELARWVGKSGATTVEELLGRGGSPGSLLATRLFHAFVVVYMSTRLFTRLRQSINHLWDIEVLPAGGMKGTFLKQARKLVVSFVMVILVEAILLTMVGTKTMLAVATERIEPAFHVPLLWRAGETLLSFGVVTVLFAAIFRVLPDGRIAWRDLWVGALVTALLFSLGAFLVSLYLGHKSVNDTFGDGGAIVMLLLWVNYSAQIFFLGVAFTGVWAERKGGGIQALPGARKIKHEQA